MSRAARAMTLLETLAALAVLSLLTWAAGAWVLAAARTQRDLAGGPSPEELLGRTHAAIARDIASAAPGMGDEFRGSAAARFGANKGRSPAVVFDAENHRIVMRTSCPAPGEPAGWRLVTWRLDGDALVRAERLAPGSPSAAAASLGVETRSVALRGVRSFRIEPVTPEAHQSESSRRANATAEPEIKRYMVRIGVEGGRRAGHTAARGMVIVAPSADAANTEVTASRLWETSR